MISTEQLERFDVDAALRHCWVNGRQLEPVGARSYRIAGSSVTWRGQLRAALIDVGQHGFVAGRAAAQLYGLDGFTGDVVEVLTRRTTRNRHPVATLRSTRRELPPSDTRVKHGLRVLTPERLILDAPIFRFSDNELYNAIDSAVRKRLIDQDHLVDRALERHNPGVRGGRALLDALIDIGGESALERCFLKLLRRGDLPKPESQRVIKDPSGRFLARIDFFFGDRLVVEVNGHATHSSRLARQRDAERITNLTIEGLVTVTFTYEDVTRRPEWVIDKLRQLFAVLNSPRGHI